MARTGYSITCAPGNIITRFFNFGYFVMQGQPEEWPKTYYIGCCSTRWGAQRMLRKYRAKQKQQGERPKYLDHVIHREGQVDSVPSTKD